MCVSHLILFPRKAVNLLWMIFFLLASGLLNSGRPTATLCNMYSAFVGYWDRQVPNATARAPKFCSTHLFSASRDFYPFIKQPSAVEHCLNVTHRKPERLLVYAHARPIVCMYSSLFIHTLQIHIQSFGYEAPDRVSQANPGIDNPEGCYINSPRRY